MKKLNQKQWGILGTSLGSVLIIVALLTMVGIGSGDTYAATTNYCSCTKGTRQGNECIVKTTNTYSCCTGLQCTIRTGASQTCTSTDGCSVTSSKEYGTGSTKYMVTEYSCTETTETKETCTCTVGTPNSTGVCSSQSSETCSAGSYKTTGGYCTICPVGSYCPGDNAKHDCPSNTQQGQSTCGETCKAGEYRIAGDCVTCTQGSYCPGDGSINACPSDKPKSNAGSSSVSDCNASGSLACKAGEYRIAGDCVTCTQGSYCPGDGSIQACPTDKPKSNAGSSSVSDCKASGSDTSYVHCDKGWFYTGDDKTCTKCPSGSWCPGGNFPSTSLIRDGGVKCPDDRPYSEPGSDEESDCKASGNGGADPSNPSSSGGSGGGNPSNPSSGGSSGNGGNGGNGGNNGGSTSGNGSNTNTNPSTATKTPLVIVIIGMVAMGLGTFTYYKSKNNEI